MHPLYAPLETLPGIGPKLRKILAEQLHICSVVDLLLHIPYAYIDRQYMPHSAREVESSRIVTLPVEVLSYEDRSSRFSKKPFKVHCQSAIGKLTIQYYHRYVDSVKKQLPLASTRLVSGKCERYGAQMMISHPDYVLPMAQADRLPKIEPHYRLTQGVTQALLRKTIAHALALLPAMQKGQQEEWWPEVPALGFCEALHVLHQPNPQAMEQVAIAKARLAEDELYANQLALALQRTSRQKAQGIAMPHAQHYPTTLRAALPYQLTAAQEQALQEILADLHHEDRMFRLLQGDVGSGKTVVALLAMLEAVEAGFQAAIMAPTEILAQQHGQWITEILQEAGLLETLNPVLLTGSLPAAEKRRVGGKIADNAAKIIIGTHALFQDMVHFARLGLVIVDEQHRFGVQQRQLLLQKAQQAEALFMSATPIPRTLMMTLYGDMELSLLRGKPPGRKEVDTRIISLDRVDEVMARLARAIEAGDQIYWVCPLIEESEMLDLTPAETRYEQLHALYPGKIGLLHGRMHGAEKTAIMQRFMAGELAVLVATTVIEVGVNVENACVMIIEHAQRFGLSQLHQLRGRVGRGHKAASCLLLYGVELSAMGKQRLEAMRESNDGFYIAEQDLLLRGSGDVLGTKQSGLPHYRIAVLPDDNEGLLKARHASQYVVEQGLHSVHHHLLSLFGYDAPKHKA